MTALPTMAWFLTGPTASGKSAVAQWIAEQEGWAILSADSMLVYRGLDIGTDKPSPADRQKVRYWGLDLADPRERFSVARFLEAAAEALAQTPAGQLIVVGGTGLYLKALTEGLDAAPPADSKRRAELEEILRREGIEALRRILRERDPRRLEQLQDPANPRRLIRAIEQVDLPLRRRWKRAGPPLVGLRPEPGRLREHIAARVQRIFEAGFLNEVRGLRDRTPSLSDTALQAIGYAEALAVLDQRLTEPEAREQMVRRTWQLARRQMTWFRHQAHMIWIDHDFSEPVPALAERVRAAWRTHGPTPVILPE